jgi:hypothetical protein
MHGTTSGGLKGDDAPDAKFNVVRVGTEGEESRERRFSRGHE